MSKSRFHLVVHSIWLHIFDHFVEKSGVSWYVQYYSGEEYITIDETLDLFRGPENPRSIVSK